MHAAAALLPDSLFGTEPPARTALLLKAALPAVQGAHSIPGGRAFPQSLRCKRQTFSDRDSGGARFVPPGTYPAPHTAVLFPAAGMHAGFPQSGPPAFPPHRKPGHAGKAAYPRKKTPPAAFRPAQRSLRFPEGGVLRLLRTWEPTGSARQERLPSAPKLFRSRSDARPRILPKRQKRTEGRAERSTERSFRPITKAMGHRHEQ